MIKHEHSEADQIIGVQVFSFGMYWNSSTNKNDFQYGKPRNLL